MDAVAPDTIPPADNDDVVVLAVELLLLVVELKKDAGPLDVDGFDAKSA